MRELSKTLNSSKDSVERAKIVNMTNMLKKSSYTHVT